MISKVAKDQFHHFSHEHPLSLVHLQQPNHINETVDDDNEDEDEDEDEGKDEFVEEVHHRGQCHMCNEQIYSYHLCYYYCESCDYSLHKFCAELPMTQQNHPLHPGHDLTLSKISMDLVCATMLNQKIDHPSHSHQLERLGKTYRNFKEDEYPNLLHCPFHDEGDNLLKRHISNQNELINKQHEGEILKHPSHQHPLILFDKQIPFGKKMVSLQDPMKRIQLLCDGCVKPIMTTPFYVCCQHSDEQCSFVLHERCATLPSQVQDYADHPEHALFLMPKIPDKLFGVFECAICRLQSNGFAYGCTMCEYYVDINCAFIPKEITHDAHPDHILLKVKFSENISKAYCSACTYMMKKTWGFHCPSCDFYLHARCALLLPRLIKHKFDKHPLILRYNPVENHISEYFCEICEDKFSPWQWFYHCDTCAQSTHAACAPLICQYEKATYADYDRCVYKFLNVKFGGTLEIKDHPHRFAFVQGLESDGRCFECYKELQYKMIFKCLECEHVVDYECASLVSWFNSLAYNLV
ncbi:uncharacterized protein LOC143615341 [Bidens hawaiensis]|uniref:uncharacterized protein LOC143615341 n=1 Tax=Bidens hawaiensis TaxID=980011 RepID=UPI00404A88AA